MKKIFVAAFCFLAAGAVTAQTKATIGIRGGVNFQNINGKNLGGDKMSNSILTKFNVGVNAEIPLGDDFYIQPGVLYTTKGAKLKMSPVPDYDVNIGYLEVPINFIYKPDLGNGRLLLGVGPYIAFGIHGKVDDQSISFTNQVMYADYVLNKGAYYKTIDAGGNLLIGYELKSNISIQLNAQLGLAKINSNLSSLVPGVSDESSYKNTGFGLSLGYRF